MKENGEDQHDMCGPAVKTTRDEAKIGAEKAYFEAQNATNITIGKKKKKKKKVRRQSSMLLQQRTQREYLQGSAHKL